MSNISINIEFLEKTNFKAAVIEAKEKAAKWGVAYVCFKFNHIDMSIGPDADIEKVLSQFKHTSTLRYKITEG